MGCYARYQLLRDRPLDIAEISKLVDHLDRTNDLPWEVGSFLLEIVRTVRPDRVIAQGRTGLPDDPCSDDHHRLCDGLNRLHGVLDDIEIRISDGFDFGHLFGFDGSRVILGGQPGPDVIDVDGADLVDPATLVSRRADEAVLGGRSAPTAAKVVKALVALSKLGANDPRRAELAAQIDAIDPRVVASAGLANRRPIDSDAWKLTSAALDRLDEVAPVVDDFLDLWRHLRGRVWHEFPQLSERTVERLARDPRVEAKMLEDFATGVGGSPDDADHRRAARAAEMLVRAQSPGSRAALIGAARRLRGSEMSTSQLHQTYAGTLKALAKANAATGVPSLLLACAGPIPPWNAFGMLGRLAGSKCLPIFRAYAATGYHVEEVVEGLAAAGDTETLLLLASHDSERIRNLVIAELERLGHAAPAVEPVWALVTHPFAFIRRGAIANLESAMKPPWMLSILAAKTLGAAISKRYGDSTSSYGRYLDLLPPELRRKPHAAQLAAVRAGQVPELGEQEIWPSILPILEGDATALAANYADPNGQGLQIVFDAACSAALDAEEAAMLHALEAGRESPTLDPTPVVLAS